MPRIWAAGKTVHLCCDCYLPHLERIRREDEENGRLVVPNLAFAPMDGSEYKCRGCSRQIDERLDADTNSKIGPVGAHSVEFLQSFVFGGRKSLVLEHSVANRFRALQANALQGEQESPHQRYFMLAPFVEDDVTLAYGDRRRMRYIALLAASTNRKDDSEFPPFQVMAVPEFEEQGQVFRKLCATEDEAKELYAKLSSQVQVLSFLHREDAQEHELERT